MCVSLTQLTPLPWRKSTISFARSSRTPLRHVVFLSRIVSLLFSSTLDSCSNRFRIILRYATIQHVPSHSIPSALTCPAATAPSPPIQERPHPPFAVLPPITRSPSWQANNLPKGHRTQAPQSPHPPPKTSSRVPFPPSLRQAIRGFVQKLKLKIRNQNSNILTTGPNCRPPVAGPQLQALSTGLNSRSL